MKKIITNAAPISVNAIGILRIIVGLYFIKHGHEFFDKNAMKGFADYLQKDLGFPTPLLMAYLRTGAELFGGIMLVFGLFTRIGAFLIMITMLVATFTAAKGDLIGEGEFTFIYALFCLAFILIGSGKFSLDYYLFNNKSISSK